MTYEKKRRFGWGRTKDAGNWIAVHRNIKRCAITGGHKKSRVDKKKGKLNCAVYGNDPRQKRRKVEAFDGELKN